MPIRLTENIDRNRQLYRGRKGRIHGWTMAPGCIPEEIDDEFILHELPLVVYIHFTEVTWQIGTLPIGVYPLKKRSKIWRVNKRTGIEARRTGFWFLADFGSTAHMIQGATLEAAFVDLQHGSSKPSVTTQIAAYVCLSRVKRLENLCVIQPFSPKLFTLGNPKGPNRLIRKLSNEITAETAIDEWLKPADAWPEEAKEDSTTKKHLCASCYLKGKTDWMHSAIDFGVQDGCDLYEKVGSQGQWTRCLSCMNDVQKIPLPPHTKIPQAYLR